jgi:hypothetical protein
VKLELRIPALTLTFAAISLGVSLAAGSLEAPKIPSSVPVPAASIPAATLPSAPAVTTSPAAVPPEIGAVPAAFAKGAEGLSPKVLAMALDAVASARAQGIPGRDGLLTVIDYSLPSTERRLWVLDLAHGDVLFHEPVAHGSGSGDNYATRFSNVEDSRQTSLGLFLTGGTYEGGNGYSLKLRGLDPGVNDNAEARHIVMHGAWYVSPEHASSHGRLGRSWGCPALSETAAPRVIDTIKGGTFVFSYSGDSSFQQYESAALRRSPASAPTAGVALTAR